MPCLEVKWTSCMIKCLLPAICTSRRMYVQRRLGKDHQLNPEGHSSPAVVERQSPPQHPVVPVFAASTPVRCREGSGGCMYCICMYAVFSTLVTWTFCKPISIYPPPHYFYPVQLQCQQLAASTVQHGSPPAGNIVQPQLPAADTCSPLRRRDKCGKYL